MHKRPIRSCSGLFSQNIQNAPINVFTQCITQSLHTTKGKRKSAPTLDPNQEPESKPPPRYATLLETLDTGNTRVPPYNETPEPSIRREFFAPARNHIPGTSVRGWQRNRPRYPRSHLETACGRCGFSSAMVRKRSHQTALEGVRSRRAQPTKWLCVYIALEEKESRIRVRE